MVGKDGKVDCGSVSLVLKLDGQEVYNSGVLRPSDGWKTIDVNLEKGNILEMAFYSTEDGASGDNVVLVSPQLTYQGEKPQLVDVSTMGKGPSQSESVVQNLEKKLSSLPVMNGLLSEKTAFDWLLTPEKSQAGVYRTADGKGIVIANAMVSRTFRIFPNLATVDFTNRMLGESLLRAVSSEGNLWIDGKKWTLGGLGGQPERAYLKEEWLDDLYTLCLLYTSPSPRD